MAVLHRPRCSLAMEVTGPRSSCAGPIVICVLQSIDVERRKKGDAPAVSSGVSPGTCTASPLLSPQACRHITERFSQHQWPMSSRAIPDVPILRSSGTSKRPTFSMRATPCMGKFLVFWTSSDSEALRAPGLLPVCMCKLAHTSTCSSGTAMSSHGDVVVLRGCLGTLRGSRDPCRPRPSIQLPAAQRWLGRGFGRREGCRS